MNKTKKFFKPLNCHPSINKNKTKKNRFCLKNKNLLQTLKKKYNYRHPDIKIKSSNPEKIHKDLTKNLSHICYEEKCWIKNLFKTNEQKIIDKYFAPKHPKKWFKKERSWLDSLDIARVMNQYEETYDNFRFLGPSPIDFNKIKHNMCIYPEICNLDLSKMRQKKIDKIGVVFNTDYHYEPGSHWICVFIDLKKNIFFLFDSSGEEKLPEIEEFYQQLKKTNHKLKYKSNENFPHQRNNGECGIYCLYVLTKLLKGEITINSLKKKRIDDIEMSKYRKIFYNPI